MRFLSTFKLFLVLATTLSFETPSGNTDSARDMMIRDMMIYFIDVKRAHFVSEATRELYLELPPEMQQAGRALVGSKCGSAVHRASWRSCCARGQTQYTEPPGGAAVRVVAAGPRLAVVWQAPYTEPPGVADARGWLSCGRRSTQSFLAELLRAWSSLARGWLSCDRHSTQRLLAELLGGWSPLARVLARGSLSRGRRGTWRHGPYWTFGFPWHAWHLVTSTLQASPFLSNRIL